eukprot:3199977-Pleurochrysis_carterae.AAC.2
MLYEHVQEETTLKFNYAPSVQCTFEPRLSTSPGTSYIFTAQTRQAPQTKIQNEATSAASAHTYAYDGPRPFRESFPGARHTLT